MYESFVQNVVAEYKICVQDDETCELMLGIKWMNYDLKIWFHKNEPS